MRIVENSRTAANDGLAILAQTPGKAEARREVRPVGFVHLVGGQEVAEARPERGWSTVEDAAVGFLGNGEVVVAQAEIKGQIRADAPVVLREAAELVGVQLIKRNGKIDLNLIGDVRQKIRQIGVVE